ncbi:hepcidin-1 [Anguilla anguilla]|uniref:hepcidin-1 n=1 Tax=Anguilla anguilla TaxID=7936 RepID=UPI0015B04899|nr:hepcidin-1 [Anguilla anguilla]
MKPLSIAVVLVVLSICVLQNAALPYAEARVQETEGNNVQTEETLQTAAAAVETDPLVLSRTKRHHSIVSLCRYCCNCCKNKGCGYCCRF